MSVCIKSLIQNLNIVIGCDIGCPYCYARNNVRRFHITDDFNNPEFFEQKLRIMRRRIPHNFLLTGMSDLAGWQSKWKDEVFAQIKANPQHNFIFLTKRPENLDIDTELDNAWFGVTVTRASEKKRIADLKTHIRAKHYHVSFEPMFDDVGELDLSGVEWIVIGTETGCRKGKSVSKIEWVNSITAQAHSLGIPVFMKEDLLPVIGEENMIQELPEAFEKVLEVQKSGR